MIKNKPPDFSRLWLKSYDPHVPLEIEYPLTNLSTLFKTTANKYPNETFLSFNNLDFSFGCYGLAENMAKNLINMEL
jgi:hypothetical protein